MDWASRKSNWKKYIKKYLRNVSVKQIYCPHIGLFLDSFPLYKNSCVSQSTLQINKHKYFKQNRGQVFKINNCKLEYTKKVLYSIYTLPSWASSDGNLSFLSPFWFESEIMNMFIMNKIISMTYTSLHLFYEWPAKCQLKFQMQNVVGWVM